MISGDKVNVNVAANMEIKASIQEFNVGEECGVVDHGSAVTHILVW